MKFKIIFLSLLFIIISCSENVEFNSTDWKNWVESENTIFLRWEMSKDLIKNYSLKGMSKDEIIELLGEPGNLSSSDIFLYYLGHTGSGINTGTLKLSFINGKVVKIEILDG